MATVAELDAAYRRRQVILQGAVGLVVKRGFSRLTPDDIMDGSSAVDGWLERSTKLTLGLHDRSAREARDYYDGVRNLMAPGSAPFRHPDPPELPEEAVRTSLWVTGVVGARKRIEVARETAEPPIIVREEDQATTLADVDTLRRRQIDLLKQERERELAEAIPVAADRAGAAAARHAANGGREQVQASSKADLRALGWVRVPSGVPCYFCALLASRWCAMFGSVMTLVITHAALVGITLIGVVASTSAGMAGIGKRRATSKPSTLRYHAIDASRSGTLMPP